MSICIGAESIDHISINKSITKIFIIKKKLIKLTLRKKLIRVQLIAFYYFDYILLLHELYITILPLSSVS